MAIRLGNLIIDRILYGVASDSNDDILYVLNQLSDVSINITAESVDVNDALGSSIMTLYRAKSGELTATNAFISEPLLASKAGRDADIATTTNTIMMPKIQVVKAGETITLKGFNPTDAISVVGADGQFNVSTTKYTQGTTASATEFSIDTTGTNPVLTPPTSDDIQFIVKYKRSVTDGVRIINDTEHMPKTCSLLFKVLVIDPCSPEVVSSAYLEIPSFTPSPEMELNISGGDTQGIDYSGTMHASVCGTEKAIFIFYRAVEDQGGENV